MQFFQETFEKVTGEKRKHIVINLCYVNKIEIPSGTSIFSKINRSYFPDSIEEEPLLSQYSWRGQNCDLRISLNVLQEPSSYVLTTAAGLIVDETSDYQENAWILNKELNVLFNNLITEELSLEWERQ